MRSLSGRRRGPRRRPRPPPRRPTTGWSTCFHDSSDTWMRPSIPPRSTNAPKFTTDDTTPRRRSPGFRLTRNSPRCSFWVSSSHARRDRTTLLRLRSSSMIFASMVRPTYGWSSRTRRSSTSDAGRNPRRPMSTIRPPFTTSMTGPFTTPSDSLIFSMVPQARSYCARFFDRMSRPSLSSFWRTRASTCSPRDTICSGSTSLRIDSSRTGMTPSDLKPMSRRTSSLSIFTTVPSTMSPSSNSTMVAAIASSSDAPVEVVFGDRTGDVVPRLVEGAHRHLRKQGDGAGNLTGRRGGRAAGVRYAGGTGGLSDMK